MRALPSSVGKSVVFSICLTLAAILGTMFLTQPAAAQEQPQLVVATPRPLITEALDGSRLTVLKGNTHPLARREFDLGTAPASLPMERMLLVLKRSNEQETALRKLLDDQQDKNSPYYHKWMTPEQFGAQFGPTDADMQMITSWLQSHGFQVGSTKGRTVLEFSGSASQVQEAFHTSIHKYVVNGEQHWANASDPSIPAALVPAVKGVLTLHNFIKKPALHFSGEPVGAKLVQVPGKVRPQVTFPPQSGQPAINALAPQDYAVIYNIKPLYNVDNVGNGSSIAVIGRSNLFNGGQDVFNFYSNIGTGNGFNTPGFTIVVNGADPGDLGGGEEAEATLDSTWSGALAPGANVSLVVSATTDTTDGVDLSEAYIVENNLAGIMTESFSACELFATDTQLAGASALAEQAAAQGITYFVSSGDDGAEACDDPNVPPATHPIAVNYLASTAFNVAVGGTTFNENGNPSKYWLSTPPISETAISYIPENAWNESSATNGLWATSGGASAGNVQSGFGSTPGVPKPYWQSGVAGIPNDNVRDLPDVSLTAAGHDPYLLCFEGSCQPDAQNNLFVYFISGTSASAPSFAGIMALIDQGAGSRQGLANYLLYRLAATQSAYPAQCNGSNTAAPPSGSCIFNDVTIGNNVVPGEVGTNYQTGAGYDQATGLGSVNVANLQAAWGTVTFNPTTTTLTLNGGSAVNITHGASVPLAVTVSPSSGTGSAPTGQVVLLTGDGIVPSTMDLFNLSAGNVINSTSRLPGSGSSSYNVWAHYGGDITYAPSDSTPVSVTVTPEPSATTVSAATFDQNGFEIPFTSGPFGSFVYLRADVSGQSGFGFPTGTVTFADTWGAIPGGSTFALNSKGNTANPNGIFTFDSGTHTISASYNGDPSFSPSSTSQSQTFTITPGFFAEISSAQSTVVISTPGGLGSTSVSVLNSTGFSGTINLACSGLPLESKCIFSPPSVAANGTATTTTVSITVNTTAPTLSAQLQRRSGTNRWIVTVGMIFPAIFLIAAKRRNPVLFLMMLLTILILLPACGGGGGSHKPPPDPGTPKGTSNVTVTATSGSIVSQSGFTLVVH
ncbi:MAG TPA: protease pro-enzyme activation domain-containing protein [Candidatus Sulfotelmatobacter sp.]|nr:protease pro-enzyme activation domain-containing protein [Candidatus Sulfotelmatobacter sp.]